MKQPRNKAIEIWRMVFTIGVLLNHTMLLPWYRHGRGYLLCVPRAVEFFFLLSGYLMAASVRNAPTCTALGEDTWRFLWRKLKAIYPTYLFAAVFECIIAVVLRNSEATRSLTAILWDVLFLRLTGLGAGTETLVGASWYLSAMLLGMAFMYPLLRKYTDSFLHIIAPLLSVFILGWFMVKYNNLNYQNVFNDGGVCLGLLRAVACMSTGCWCFLIVEKIKAHLGDRDRKLTRVLWTAAELLAFGGVIWIATHYKRSERGDLDFVVVFLLGVGLTAAFSGQSLTSKWTSKLNVSWIGEYSLALYLNHYVWIRTFLAWKMPIPWKLQAVLFLLMSSLTALICCSFLQLLRQLIEKWKSYRASMAA